jgi:alpha-2-macroglobulin
MHLDPHRHAAHTSLKHRASLGAPPQPPRGVGFAASRPSLGIFGVLVLAACFRGPTHPTVTLAPAGPDAPAARTRGPFAVVYAAPKGRVTDRKAGVTVLFSRGVRSVEMADDERVPSVAIKTKSGEPVKGAWRWTGTRGLLFSPDGELPGGNDFVVTVPPDVTALDGSVLGKPYTLDLETDGPSVSLVNVIGPPGVTESGMPAEAAFRVQFDQSVDMAAVQTAASLRVFKADGDRGETIKLVASRAAAGAPPTPTTAPVKPGAKTPAAAPPRPIVPESWVVVLKPEKPLPLAQQVELSIAQTLRGAGGPHAMSAPFSRTMRTHGPLRFVDFFCPPIEAKGRCRANADVKVMMSTPVTPDELKRHVRADKLPPRPTPKPGAKTAGQPRRIDPSTEHWLGVAPKIGEQYKVTLTAGMRDIYGQKLEKDATFELVVESPLLKPDGVAADPEPAAAKGATKPKRGAIANDTRPRRERLRYLLDLGLTGHVLEAGSAHKVPVGTVNVPTFATLATSLTEAQATSWTLARGNTPDFLSRNGLISTWKTINAEENVRAVDFIDLDAALAPRKGRGPALLVVSPPGTMVASAHGRTESFITVTDLGVTAKMSPFGGLVWVTQLSTGKPLANANVAIRTAKQGEVFQSITDAQGLVVVPSDKFDPIVKDAAPPASDDDSYGGERGGQDGRVRDDAAIVVRSGDDWTITKIARSDTEARIAADFQLLSKEGRWAGMLFADRGVFRPGETAKVAGILRVVEGDGTRTIPGRELRIQLMDRNSEQIFDGRAKSDDFGTFSLDLPIPKTAEIGTATIVATASPGGTSNTRESGIFRHDIRILAFKPNEFKVTAEADKPFYFRGETATFVTQGDYLYGASMQGATVTTTVSRQEVPFTPANTEGFTVSDDVFTGDYPDETKAAAEVDSQDGTLDAKGRFERKVDLAFDDQRRPERVVFDADVQDISRNDVSARASAMVHPAEFYVALKTPKDRFVVAGGALRSEVAAVDPNGVHRAGAKVKVELVERRWSSVTGEQPDGRAQKTSKPENTVVGQCDAVTTTTVGSCDLRVPHAGYFIMRATATDAHGNTVRASTGVYGTDDSPNAKTAWAADNRNAIKLEPNKKTYELGETAKIAIQSPFNEGQALVTVERNGVLWRQVVSIKGPLPIVEVPIQQQFYPNAFVSVVAIRGRVQAAPASGADLGGPAFRFGWTEIEVNHDAHRLNVAIAEPKKEYQPGATVEADVVVKDGAGKPVESALTFYVVDEGVLALTSYTTPDPLPAFVKRRKLRTFTIDNREMLAHVQQMKAGERLPVLGYEYYIAQSRDGAYDKGDDGGDGANGIKRADFRTTAFFEAGRKTDKNGRAHFAFKLPDNLTTFRIMAVAAAADDRYGSGDSKITTFRRLMARPALPRQLRVGDSLEASVVVSSKADPAARESNVKVDVKLAAKGIALAGPSTRSITMPRGGQMEVRFPVKATAPGEAVLDFEVRSGNDVDRVEIKRQVELPVSIESTVVYGETAGDAAITLGDLSGIRRDYGGLDVRVASSALVGLGMTVDRLTDYPYGCTEQVTSKILPLVAMMDLVKDSGARMPKDPNAAIDSGVEALLKRQNGDGGFGFWDKEHSEPWLSAYAMLAVAGAAEKKRFVPKDVIDRGREYLNYNLANATRRLAKPEVPPEPLGADAGAAAFEQREKDEIAKTIDYAGASLIASTLATLGWPNPGALNVLYDARVGQRLFAQAALLYGMAKSDINPAQVKTLAKEVESRLRVGPNGVDVDESDGDRFGSMLESPTRTHAMVLRALLAADPKNALAPRLARRLLALRQPNGAWRSTQEDAWALLALADYRKLQESGQGALEVSAELGGSEILMSKFPRGALREDKVLVSADTLVSKGPTLSFEARGGGNVYYSAQLKYATSNLPTKARDEGLFVTKYVRSVAPAAVNEALGIIPKRTETAVTAGDLVIVDLLFESAEPRDHVVLDDPLPAGLEALDYDLDTTSKANRDAASKPLDPNAKWLGSTFQTAAYTREVRDDRVLTFFDKIEPGMYRIRYLARATSIGSFIVPPTRIEGMYAPEVYGRTAASSLTVKAKP